MQQMVLGQLIVAWRQVHGVSLRTLAKTIGVDPMALYRVERGRSPNCRVLALIFCWLLDRNNG